MLSVSDKLKPLEQAESVIRLENIFVRYRAPEERIGTFKEYVIRFLRRQIQYKDFKALNNVSLDVRKGEILGIIGRNGAGKSTLLKIISRVLIPKSGKVWIKGRVAPLLELGAGFHPELTGRENIFVNGTLLGHKHSEIDDRLDSILEFAEIAEFIDAPLRTYSSGMIARLGFAVATAWTPDILIVDEVLGVGDHAFQQKCQARMQEFRNSGTTILLVTHDTNTVRKLCDRVVWLDHGAVKGIGSTEQTLETYLYTSTFSVWLSFVDGHVLEDKARHSDELFSEQETLFSVPVEVNSGIQKVSSYLLQRETLNTLIYPDDDSLVSLNCSADTPFCAGKHILYKNTFSQVMGVSPGRFSTCYWFPVYDAQSTHSIIVVNNPDTSRQADVDIVFAGEIKASYQVAAGGYIHAQFPGQMRGPVSVISKNGVLIFASQQILYGDSFIEVPGLAQHELARESWFPWFNSQNIRSWIVVANPDAFTPIDVDVFLSKSKQGQYQIPAGGTVNLYYPDVMAGPLRITSRDGRSVLAAQCCVRGNSFSEIPGFTPAKFSTEYWFPWHDYQSMISRIIFSNPDSHKSADVEVFVGGKKQGRYNILAGETIGLDYRNVIGGPVRVISVNDVPVFATQRFSYGNAFAEIAGLPASEFSSQYWFSRHDPKSKKAWLVLSPFVTNFGQH